MTATRLDPGKGGAPLGAVPPVSPPGPPPRQDLAGLSIEQVNHVVQGVHDNHMRLFGTKANPGLVFDVARGVQQGLIQDVNHLFDLPRSQREALMRTTVERQPVAPAGAGFTRAGGATHPDPQMFRTLEDQRALSEAGIGFGSHAKWLSHGLGEILDSLVSFIPGTYNLAKAGTLDARDSAYRLEHDVLHIPVARPAPKKDMRTDRLKNLGGQMLHQVVQDFTHADNWGYALMDFWAAASLGAGGASRVGSAAARAGEFGAGARAIQAAKGLAPNFDDSIAALEKHSRSIVYGKSLVFKDAHTKAMELDKQEALSAAKYLRAAQAKGIPYSEAVRKVPEDLRFHALGEKFLPPRLGEQILQGLEGFRKPGLHPGFDIGYGSYTEHIPAFENAALRIIQGQYLKGAQERLLTRQLGKDADGDFSGFDDNLLFPHNTRRGKLYDSLFSTENLLHRQRMNRNNIEYAIATAPLVELARLNNWTARTKSVLDRMGDEEGFRKEYQKMSAQERFGIDKAIQLIMTDSPDPISAWRSFHQRMIDDVNEQRKDFESFTQEEADSLRAAHDTHIEAARDLEAQAKSLDEGQIQNMRIDQAESLMRYTPAVQSPSIRALARKLVSEGFGDETVLVRERKLTAEQKETIRKKEDQLHDLIIKLEEKTDNRGRLGMERRQAALEKEIQRLKNVEGQSLHGERAHDLVAAARLAGIQDIPAKIRVVGDREIANLRAAAKEQQKLARTSRPRLRKAEAIMGMSKKERADQIREYDYRVASHQGQMQAIDVAEKILLDPPKRFKAIVDRAYEISAMQEELKEITYGFDPVIGNQHLAEIAAILNGEKVVPLLDEEGNATNRLGRVVEGAVPDSELRKDLRAATTELRSARRQVETLKLRKAKRTKASPKLDAQMAKANMRAHNAENDLLKAQERHDTLGSRTFPLQRDISGNQEVYHASVYVNTNTGEIVWGKVDEHHESLLVRMGYHKAEDSVIRGHAAIKSGVFERLQRAYDRATSEGWVQGAVNLSGDEAKFSAVDLPPASEKLDVPSLQKAAERQYASQISILKAREGRGSAYFGRLERLPEATSEPKMPRPRRNRRFGFGPPKDATSALARMDGTVLEIGDMRWDTSQLLASELRQMWKAAFAMSHYNDLWSIGIKEKISEYHQPIRDIATVPEALKKVVAALERHVVDPDAAKILSQENLDKLRAYLYPTEKEAATDIKHVRWVDERMSMSRFGGETIDFWRNMDEMMSRGTGWINEPWRLLVIFGSPAYVLNAGGAAVTLAVEHGFASIPHWGRALASNHIWSPEVTKMLDQLAGSTHAAAISTEKLGKWTTGSQHFYRAWQKITDRSFRRAAVIGELYKRGLIHDGMSAEQVLEVLQQGTAPMLDKLRRGPGEGPLRASDIGKQVIEAAQVGRKQMLDFDKMSWPERATLRHLIFVYAFLRAGSVWSLRFMGEHPVKWAVTAQAGRDRKLEIENLIGKAPDWFYKGAYMPLDNNTVWNPVQFNMPSVLSQVAYSTQSLFSDAPYTSVGDMMGPVVTLGTDIARGTTSAGQPLPKASGLPFGTGRIAGSFLDLLENTPPGYALQRQQKLARQEKRKVPPPPVVVSETEPLQGASRRERAFLNLNSFDLDGFWNNWGRLIGRTAVPEDVNNLALQARYWRDLRKSDPDAFAAHQLDLANEVAQRQAHVLGLSSVPADVQNALNLVAAREAYIEKWKLQEKIPTPGDRQLAVLTIAFLKQQGIIDNAKANEYKGMLAKAHGKSAQRGVWLKALRENGGQAWADWTQQVNAVNFFNTDHFTQVALNLRDAQLGDYSDAVAAPNETKWDYGRQFAAYIEQRNELKDQASAAPDPEQRRVYKEQLRALDDAHSDEVNVGGVTFPAMRAIQFGRLNPEQRQSFLRGKSIAPWWSQDAYTKELLTGQKPDPSVAEGYAILASWLEQKQESLPIGHHLPAGIRTFYAQTLADRAAAKGNTSLRDDLIFSGIIPKPDGTRTLMAERLARTTPIMGSLYRAQWEYMLGYATYAFKKALDNNYVDTKEKPIYGAIADLWRSYYVPRVKDWLSKQAPGFQREVEAYVDEHAHFLDLLAKP